MKKIRIGTRSSSLALWQANHIRELLKKNNIECDIKAIQTKGDKILDISLSKIGSKGLFTQEIENLLDSEDIDIAVHSAKDLPATLPSQFEIIAFSKRENPHDVLISNNDSIDFNSDKTIIGTSSTRRIAMLHHYFPNVLTRPIRGNLQTRIKRMEEGNCTALMLAFAGVKRMNYQKQIIQNMSLNEFTPPVGQGSIAVECKKTLDEQLKFYIKSSVSDYETELTINAERSFLSHIQGGCSIPVFALATVENNEIHIQGGILSLDGKKNIKRKIKGSKKEALYLGEKLANMILQSGGRELLFDINSQLKSN